MPATVIVGLQWGDEGKGKTTDFLAEQVAMAVRYQGGDNAGHTIVLGDEVFKLHLVPSGVLYPHITCVIGAGVVVNPATLISELDGLTARHIEGDPGETRTLDLAIRNRSLFPAELRGPAVWQCTQSGQFGGQRSLVGGRCSAVRTRHSRKPV